MFHQLYDVSFLGRYFLRINSMVSSTGTLVNSDTTSKLTSIYPDSSVMSFMRSMKWLAFFMWDSVSSAWECSCFARNLSSSCSGDPNELTMGFSEASSLWILGRLYSFRHLDDFSLGIRFSCSSLMSSWRWALVVPLPYGSWVDHTASHVWTTFLLVSVSVVFPCQSSWI